jgi:hypothetical protein
MNLKHDYSRLKQLILKVRGKSLISTKETSKLNKDYGIFEQSGSKKPSVHTNYSDPELREQDLNLKAMEEEFNVVGVN